MHQSRLRQSLRQLTGWNTALADDIAQETFIKAYRSITKFKGSSKFSTWLYRIGYNEFLQHVRKNQPMVSLEGIEQESSVNANDGDDRLHKAVATAMQELSVEQRAALHLTLQRECTHQEVAEIMGCSLGTAKSHILRGKEKLRDLLSEWHEEAV